MYRTTSIVAAAVFVAGCGFFDVTSPGTIADPDLDQDLVMKALVTGMSSDFSTALDDVAFLVARASDEMTGSGSYFDTGLLRRGIINPEDVNFEWEAAQRARWVAERGLDRMREVMAENFATSPLSARAFFLAGLSNRLLGECFCEVVFDGGAAQPHTVAFERALPWLDSAIALATAAGVDSLATAAHGVKAQAYVGLGDWASATAEAAQVPTDFTYIAFFSNNSGREENVIYRETWRREEMSAYGVLAGSFDPPDPRAPYTNLFAIDGTHGADGSTPHYRQDKYPDIGADIPVVKGTEMRLIEAEAFLVTGDFTNAMAKINEARAFYGLGTLSAADSAEAFTHLDNERNLTLWLEGRRLFDLRRWNHPFLQGGGVVYPGEPQRASCIPIALSECQTNPNLSCG